MKSMAVEAILLLQEKINDEDEETVKMQLLVASKVVGCVIGKSGSVITQIRKRTNASIRISKGNNIDDLVEVIINPYQKFIYFLLLLLYPQLLESVSL